jgi:hypothetical protein
MKKVISILFCSLFGISYGQYKDAFPVLENVSRADISITEPLKPGKKIVFTQKCNPNLPDTVSNGVVQFENLRAVNDVVIASIEFKDTIVQKLIFEFQTNDNDAWKYFNIPSDGFTELGKKSYYQTYVVDGYEYTCLINRQKVTLIKTSATQ